MVRCAVYGCTSNNKKTKVYKRRAISYFRFPKANRKLSRIWVSKCGRKDVFNLLHSRICSLHFEEWDFERNLKDELLITGEPARRFLRNNAVPSLLLPDSVTKMENGVDTEAETIVEIKEEPLDISFDEELLLSDAEDSNDIFPKLSAYLQLTSNNASTAAPTKPTSKIMTTIAGTTASSPSEPNTAIPNTIKIGQPMVLAQQQQQQGKISLVPTNILLKPQQQQIQLRQPAQHIIYNSALAGNSTIATSGAPGQMANGMKVLLVNTLPKSSVAVASNDAQPKLITSNAMKANCITSTVPNIGESKLKSHESKKSNASNAGGFRTLLSQLITIQTQNLEVSKQRLEVERQRLDFEKSVAERVIAALPNIFMPPNNNNDSVPLLIPKIEKED